MATAASFSRTWQAFGGRKDVLRVDGQQLVVHRAGAGIPVVAIHGWAMGGQSFAPQLELTRQGFELIAPDLPGFAGSPGPDVTTHSPRDASSISAYSELFRALIETMDLDQVILVGWSMGAAIAWHLASRNDQFLAGLISIDMSPKVAPAEDWQFAMSPAPTPATIKASLESMAGDWPAYCDLFLDRIFAHPDDIARTSLARLALAADSQIAALAWQSLMAIDLRRDLPQIAVPSLTIHGGQSRLYPVTVAAEIARSMPNCRALVFEEAGHAPHIEIAPAFNAAVSDLAARGIRTKAPRHPLSSHPW